MIVQRLSSLMIPLLAGIIYGSWAAYSNSEYGFAIGLRTGIAQGSYAFFSTWIVTEAAKRIYFKFSEDSNKRKGIIAGFMASFGLMLSIPLIIHTLIETPDMWQSMAPGLIWGSVYIALYLSRLNQQEGVQVTELSS